MVTRVNGNDLTLGIHVVFQDHVQVKELHVLCRLRQNKLTPAKDVREVKCSWDFNGVQVREGLEGPDSSCAVQ